MISYTTHLLSLALALLPVSSLKVASNSPCSSFCLDPNSPDYPQSSTRPEDIVCSDSGYLEKEAGQRFQRCVTCLEGSGYGSGVDWDQYWFLYNIRYSFTYCILSYPNATSPNAETPGSNPCQTSTACGGLQEALTLDGLNPAATDQFSYCGAGGGSSVAMSSDSFDKCLQCVRAGNAKRYLANFLVALKANCDQHPQPGISPSLNSTLFTTSAAGPLIFAPPPPPKGPNTPLIAALSITSAIIALLISACTYMHIRRRANRRRRTNPKKPSIRRSSLSFRCMTRVTPRAETFEASTGMGETDLLCGKRLTLPREALFSNPVRYSTLEPILEKSPLEAQGYTHSQSKVQFRPQQGLTPLGIPTSVKNPAFPSPVYTSSPASARTPVSATDPFATPVSAGGRSGGWGTVAVAPYDPSEWARSPGPSWPLGNGGGFSR